MDASVWGMDPNPRELASDVLGDLDALRARLMDGEDVPVTELTRLMVSSVGRLAALLEDTIRRVEELES